jgi:D-tyrosyl-tRNA(Tyr) deacylase
VRALLQRVASAQVSVAGEVVGSIGPGLCAFIGVTHSDGIETAEKMAQRLWSLRIFEDGEGQTNLSAEMLGRQVLLVSQFTLYADTSRGRRPSFVHAAPPEQAEPLVGTVATALRSLGAVTATGRFGASMAVELVNDGPFTILLEV